MTDCRFRLAVKNIPARTPGAVDKCGRIFTRRPNCNLQQVRLARAVIATTTSVRGSEASKSRDLHRAIDIRIATRYGAALIDCRHQPINIAPIISFSASLVSPPPIGSAKYCDERVCLSVCVFACPRSYLRNYTSDLHEFFYPCYPSPWLVPLMAA